MSDTSNKDCASESIVNSLVRRAACGDTGAFGEIYDMYADNVYRYVFYRTGNKCDAQDLTQEIFLKAWKALPRYRFTKIPFIGWLLTISHNRVVDYYRMRKHCENIDQANPSDFATTAGNNPLDSEEMQEEIRRAMVSLPESQQQVVMFSFIEGYEYSEIARIMRKSEGNIRVMVHRALKKMREIIEKAA